jgi:hypothetical protein
MDRKERFQFAVDNARRRVLAIRARNWIRERYDKSVIVGVDGMPLQLLKPPPVAHLWPTSEKITGADTGTFNLVEYALRDGNAPSDSDRPEYLRGINLEIDVGQLDHAALRRLLPGEDFDQILGDPNGHRGLPQIQGLPFHRYDLVRPKLIVSTKGVL